ncbi:MAG: chitobiase/beta-hexosaminidase C-terminal domain-containing protein, partial [Lachnospiraceae bacterium]|nr:chitobiase/beta-hexosaminidase C-terminal domain-containing protein [Lachnospiraceae bacterium]
MICPNCGAEIPDGLLLCEKCGQEIRIVPDFEPEVEDSITKSLSDVADELVASGIDISHIGDTDTIDLGRTAEADEDDLIAERHTSLILRIGGFLILLMIAMIVLMSIHAYHETSSYQLGKAESYARNGDYAAAIESLRTTEENASASDFAGIRFRMAEYYLKMGDETSYINTLQSIIQRKGISVEDSREAYEELFAYYISVENYSQINSILQNCNDTYLTEKYVSYMANAPQFNYVEGSYNVMIPLKLLANTSGTIYYTLDGTEPTSQSLEYSSLIFLEDGDYIVTAKFINDYGVESPLSRGAYHIDVTVPFAPEVDAYSGTYYTPQLLHVEAVEDCTVYYTIDGEDPTTDSTLFNGFLPMPLGEHTIKFVAVDHNMVS